MPKRTNDFQKLILAINEQLADSEATVEESKLIWDHESEQDREIDIFIESNSGPYPVKIGIECLDRSRPLDTPMVTSLIHKHRNCAITQSIIVSKSGFAKPALRMAKKNGVQAITFGKAKGIEWPKFLDTANKIHLNVNSVRVDDLNVSLKLRDGITNPVQPKKLYFVDQRDNSPVSIDEHIKTLLELSEKDPFSKRSDFISKGETSRTFTEEWVFETPLMLHKKSEIDAICTKLSGKFTAFRTQSSKELKVDKFGKYAIAYGQSNSSNVKGAASVLTTVSGDEKTQNIQFKIFSDEKNIFSV